MKCPKCGKDNPLGSRFCNDCGEKLSEQTETEERVPLPPSIFKDVPEPEPTEIKKSESKLKLFLNKIEEKQTLSLVIGIIICVIFFLIIVAVFSTCNSSTQVDSSRANTYSSASESSDSKSNSSQTTNSSNFNSIEPIVISDLDRTVKFHDISLKVSRKWEHKIINENNECYYIDGTSFFVSLQRKEISREVSDVFAELVLENSDGEYTSVRKDNVNGVDGVAFTSLVDNEHIARASAFYVNDSSYFVSIVCKKEYEEEMMLSLPLIRASVTFKLNKSKTEPATEKPTPKPTEAPTSITDTLPLIFSNDEFDIYFVSAKPYEYDDNETLVKFLINNKYNTKMTFQADTIILDGISYSDVIMSDPVSANSLGYIEATVEDCTNFNPSAVGGDLRFFDTIGEGATRGDINIPSTNIK